MKMEAERKASMSSQMEVDTSAPRYRGLGSIRADRAHVAGRKEDGEHGFPFSTGKRGVLALLSNRVIGLSQQFSHQKEKKQ